MVAINTTSEAPPPGTGDRPRQRAYHTKSKTGCGTCRIRRVRCGEEKPVCVRCTSTGRVCDGYTSVSPFPSPLASTSKSSSVTYFDPVNPVADFKLTLPRQNSQEVRSYRYFLEVTAPSLSGSFYADFWLVELPRVCLSDAAIWHAVVSLGSAHEDFTENHQGSRSLFALKQFNSSIRCLTESRSPRYADRWRALIHILTNLRLYLDALQHGGIIDSPALLSQNKTLNTWRSYTAPRSSCLRPEDITYANRAAESLLSGLILFSQQNAKHLLDLHSGKAGTEVLSMLIVRQEGHTRCFNEIAMTINMFQEEISSKIKNPGYRTCFKAHTLLPLRLLHTTNRLLLIQDPDEHDTVRRQLGLSALFTCIVDLAEDIINLDPAKTRGMSYTAQLFFVAHSGISRLTRQRAIALLRRPRLESGWDSLISASLAEAIMNREREAEREYQLSGGSETQTHGSQEEIINPIFRIFNINLRKKTHQVPRRFSLRLLYSYEENMLPSSNSDGQGEVYIANLGAELLPLMHKCPPLEEVMTAIGALEASRRATVKSSSGRHSPDQVALRSYGKSLQKLQSWLQLPDALNCRGSLWCTLLLALFELMTQISGDQWLNHLLFGISRILQLSSTFSLVDQLDRRLFASFRSLEVNRAIIYGADTLFSQGSWLDLDSYYVVDRASSLETMFDLFIEVSTFSKTFFEKIEFLKEALWVDDTEISVLAAQGFVFLRRLENWYQSNIPRIKTTDTYFKLSLANYHSLCLFICKNYTYHDSWDLDDIPKLTASEIKTHVDAVIALATTILQDAIIPGILILFALRMAGSNASEHSQRQSILCLLDQIVQRGFLVSHRIIIDLKALWEYEGLKADFSDLHDGDYVID
ncbi:transcriptional regulatory moc3 [Fusarium heterosporum]|uniref:Transcriptional regulatory moc3 n=1 Tax=Fusarium heterosporum TaxID=42747 RepID=A0A8H5WXC7_FUSHE|nr:transcriptional regulatory moc3 [Fusarium heterosporum]